MRSRDASTAPKSLKGISRDCSPIRTSSSHSCASKTGSRLGSGPATTLQAETRVNGQQGSVGAGHSPPSRERLHKQGAHLLLKTARALFVAHADLRGYVLVQKVSQF